MNVYMQLKDRLESVYTSLSNREDVDTLKSELFDLKFVISWIQVFDKEKDEFDKFMNMTKNEFSLMDEFCSPEEAQFLFTYHRTIDELRRIDKSIKTACKEGRNFITIVGCNDETIDCLTQKGYTVSQYQAEHHKVYW